MARPKGKEKGGRGSRGGGRGRGEGSKPDGEAEEHDMSGGWYRAGVRRGMKEPILLVPKHSQLRRDGVEEMKHGRNGGERREVHGPIHGG
jgi:hypothetical protein